MKKNNIDLSEDIFYYELEFKVRDYECDLQGIVNNSVYQNYYEHTRHEYFQSAGFILDELHLQEIDPVVFRIEIDYKKSLKSGDVFLSKLNISKQGNLKMIFNQVIVRKSDNMIMNKAKVESVVLKKGKPVSPDFLLLKLPGYKI